MPEATYDKSTDYRYQFFRASGFDRRKVQLDKPPILQSNKKGDNRKIVFNCKLYLTGQSFIGFPQFLQSAYESVEKEGSLVSCSSLDGFILEGLDLEFFSTESGGKWFTRLVNKNLYDFRVEREDYEDTTCVVLKFKFRTKESFGSFGLWSKHGKHDIFCEFIPNSAAVRETNEQQMVLGEDPDDNEEPEDQDPEDADYPDQDPERAAAVKED